MDTIIRWLRTLLEEMENDDWEEQEAAVLITRDEEGYITFCGCGEWGTLVEDAARTRRTAA